MAKQQIINPNMFIPRMPSVRQASRGYAMPAQGAVVYGDIPALESLPNAVENIVNARLNKTKQEEAEAQRIAQMWRDNELKAADGQLWSDQLAEFEKKHVLEGQKLMQQGINPYESMNPAALKYRQERRNIEALRAYRQSVEKEYLDLLKKVRENPEKYDPESLRELQDFITNGNIMDYYRSGARLPMLQGRFDPNEALKGLTAPITTNTSVEGNRKITETNIDRPATERAVLSRIMATPEGQRYISRITGGLPVQDVLTAPDTVEENIQLYNKLYEGSPQFRAALAAQGIAGTFDPKYAPLIQSAAVRRVQAKQALRDQMDKWVSQVSSGLKLGRSETPDFTEARFNLQKQQAAEASASRRLLDETRRQALKSKLKATEKHEDRKKWIADIQGGDERAIKNFNAALQEIGGRAERKGDITYIYIPYVENKKDEYGQTTQERGFQRIRVGKDSGEAGRIRINEVMNRLKSIGNGSHLDVFKGIGDDDPLGVLRDDEYIPENDPLGVFD